MRIALIGDLQYRSPEDEKLHYKMSQIADLNPEFAVVMGDFGGPKMRSSAGLEETRALADLLGCPWHAILGNHDGKTASVDINSGARFDCFGGFAEQEITRRRNPARRTVTRC